MSYENIVFVVKREVKLNVPEVKQECMDGYQVNCMVGRLINGYEWNLHSVFLLIRSFPFQARSYNNGRNSVIG